MNLIRVGITHGDINGIGLELIAKALAAPEILEICTPVLFSDENCFMQTAQLMEFEQPIPLEVIRSAKEVMDGRVNLVLSCSSQPQIEWGQQTESALKAEADSLNKALDAYKAHIIDLLLCAPGQLDNDMDTHSLSDFIRQAIGSTDKEFDWIINGDVRTLKLHPVAFSTELGEGFAIEAFKEEINLINGHLRQDFGFIRPRIALISTSTQVAPYIKELQEEGKTIFGPFDGSNFIEQGWEKHYDAVLFLEDEESRHRLINQWGKSQCIGYVSGMPIVLTYPLTGISYQLAGKAECDATSFRLALYTAIDILRSRKDYRKATHHPLEKQWVPKGRDDFKLDLTKEE